MVAIGMGIIWWGYLQALYGYTLLKGFDITWKDLANPIHPYQWPKPPAQPPLIPPTQVMPGKPPASPSTTGAQQPATQTMSSGPPPGQVNNNIGNQFPKIGPPPGRQ